MTSIDIRKIPKELVNKTLAEFDPINAERSSLSRIINLLTAVASTNEVGTFSGVMKSRKIRTTKGCVFNDFPGNGLIVDVVGPFDANLPNAQFSLSLLAGRYPKIYILPYVWFVEGVRRATIEQTARLTVWVDDVIARLKYERTDDHQRDVNDAYTSALHCFGIERVAFSSEILEKWILPQWLVERAQELTWLEFCAVLPFHKRNPHLITIFDLIHFLWYCYIFAIDQSDYYCTAINNKRQALTVLKLLRVKKTIIFLPRLLMSKDEIELCALKENIDPQKLISTLNQTQFNHLWRFFSFAFPNQASRTEEEQRRVIASHLKSKLRAK